MWKHFEEADVRAIATYLQTLSDEDTSNLVTYVRASFGNQAGAVTAA